SQAQMQSREIRFEPVMATTQDEESDQDLDKNHQSKSFKRQQIVAMSGVRVKKSKYLPGRIRKGYQAPRKVPVT
ncbi:unnamed protein product, partial [Didymodactylos carnosus]